MVRTLLAGKLTESLLRLFTETEHERVLARVRELNIRVDLKPVLPTRSPHSFSAVARMQPPWELPNQRLSHQHIHPDVFG
eukprot:SM000047S16877  [mRNA]  locus=s47:453921:455048:- [translate_table: standard]